MEIDMTPKLPPSGFAFILLEAVKEGMQSIVLISCDVNEPQ